MTWGIELLDPQGKPYRLAGSTILATRATEEEAHETGEWFTEEDAAVSGYRVSKVDSQA